MGSIYALVLAAGRGARFGGSLPKQYLPLAEVTVLRHAINAFAANTRIAGVQVTIRPEDREAYDNAVVGLNLLPPVSGGAERQDSVRLGLEALAPLKPGRVLIHDGARPLPDAAMIDRVIGALDHAPAAIPGLPLGDTIKRVADGVITNTIDRSGLWRVQTPQGFHFDTILAAHRAAAGQALTDDAAVAEAAGIAPLIVVGSEQNLKITTTDDLVAAERLIAARRSEFLGDVRVGQGFDVHPFGPGDSLMVCGVKIAHSAGVVGHSDADVGLHALTDAVLGAIGAGDIGMHFPPSEAQWKGASSDRFLAHAAGLVHAKGGSIAQLDVTIVCERPRIGPHRTAMIERVATIAGVAPDRISVKATTTEKLGFTGRGEGIAAQAVATVRLPLRASSHLS